MNANSVKDELKRHSRTTKQLSEEQQVLETFYKVSTYAHAMQAQPLLERYMTMYLSIH